MTLILLVVFCALLSRERAHTLGLPFQDVHANLPEPRVVRRDEAFAAALPVSPYKEFSFDGPGISVNVRANEEIFPYAASKKNPSFDSEGALDRRDTTDSTASPSVSKHGIMPQDEFAGVFVGPKRFSRSGEKTEGNGKFQTKLAIKSRSASRVFRTNLVRQSPIGISPQVSTSKPSPELARPSKVPFGLRFDLLDDRIDVFPAEAQSLIASNSSASASNELAFKFPTNFDAVAVDPSRESPELLESSIENLVLYSIVLALATIVLTLLISICILLAQMKVLKRRLRRQMEQALTVQNCAQEDSTFKTLNGTDYWSHFRRILMGGRAPDPDCYSGGEFDVAFQVGREVPLRESRQFGCDSSPHLPARLPGHAKNCNDSTLDVGNAGDQIGLRETDYNNRNENGNVRQDSAIGIDRSFTCVSGRYEFPGSDMTKELYERRGVDLNNNA